MRILVVDEGRISGTALVQTLQNESDMLVSTQTRLAGALPLAGCHDVALVNTVTAPFSKVLELVRLLATSHPELKVLVVGVEEQGAEVLACIEAGADGYVSREDSVEQLVAKVRAAHRNEALISPQVAGDVMRRIIEIARTDNLAHFFSRHQSYLEALTAQEQEVLGYLSRQMTLGEIGRRLNLSEEGVHQHVRHILQKLNVTDPQQAIAVYKLRMRSSVRPGLMAD